MSTSEDIKLMLEIQHQAYKNTIEILMQEVNNRMKLLETHNRDLVHSLEFTQRQVDDLTKDNKTLKEEIVDLKKEITMKTEVEDKLQTLKDRIDYQEDYSRRNNLRFSGLEENVNESWEETQAKIRRLLQNQFKLESVPIERAHRVGPRNILQGSRPRTVVARFNSFNDRQLILRNSQKLKGTNIFISEDLCESSMELRRAQLPALKQAKASGKVAYFSHTKLIIRDRSEASGSAMMVNQFKSSSSAVAGVSPPSSAAEAGSSAVASGGAVGGAAAGADAAADAGAAHVHNTRAKAGKHSNK